MAGRLMEDEDFEGTFADELEMMRDIEQESQQERVSDGLDKASRKRSLDAPGNKGSAEKRIMLIDDKDDILEEESENSFQDSVKQPHAGNRQANGRRPLQLSNLGSLEQHHLGVLGYGKGSLGPSDMYEDSGDFVVDPESEIFSMERQTQDLAGDGQVESQHGVRDTRSSVLSVPPPSPYISVTGSSGHRVYLRLSKPSSLKEQIRRRAWSRPRTQLLTVPFADLKAIVEEERRSKTLEDSQEVLESLLSDGQLQQDTPVLFGSEQASSAAATVEPVEHSESSSDHQLWVDKYAPRLFTELLSDNGINRTLLSWLRLWDEVVFGSPTPFRNAANKESVQAGKVKGSGWKGGIGGAGEKKQEGSGPASKGGRSFERVDYQNPETFSVAEALDENKRPKPMLSLLCGPPGLGKTTLAHIIATHAGYNVVEMNASDDRSLEVFRQKVEAATKMKSVLAKEGKPNCLIIDEIDGAPTPTINFLVDLVKVKGKKSKDNKDLLSRPIICICNDQYTPSLRQLRQNALLLHFPPTVASRLASRLQQVVKKEGMRADMPTLMALCEKADNDVRACLNTVQFLGRDHQDLTLNLIRSVNVGQKDAQRSLFSLWKEVFQLPTVGKKHGFSKVPQPLRGGVNMDQEGKKNIGLNATRFHTMLITASAVGEFLKVTNGLFENYLAVKFKDPNLDLVTLGLEWLVFYDILQQRINVTQDYSVLPYLPCLSVIFHFLFAISSRSQIKYPSVGYEVTMLCQRNQHMLSSLLLGMPPPVKQNLSPTTLSVETLPPLCEIISPTFRPVNTQLYSAQEKRQLSALVNTMISYGLLYKQEKGQDGQYTYILDPSIEDVTHFSGLLQRRQLTYAAKQLIAREIEMEKLRRAEAILSSKSLPSVSTGSAKKSAMDTNKSAVDVKKVQTKKPFVPSTKEVDYKVDFFGRKVPVKKNQSSANQSNATTHPLWFRFNEGFSNAVRRPVYVKDLL